MSAGAWRVVGVLLLAALLISVGSGASWKAQDLRYGKQLSELAQQHQASLAAISSAGAAQVRQALEKQQAAEQAMADLDAKATKEKANDLVENERLRRAADDSARRLRIAGNCSAGSGSVPVTASTAGLGNAGTVELAPTAGQTVFDIRAGIIADQAALRALQRYVQEVCR